MASLRLSVTPKKEPERARHLIDVRPGSLLRDQMKLVGANVLDPEPVRRLVEILEFF